MPLASQSEGRSSSATSPTTSRPLRLRKLIEERPAEGSEPAFHAGLEQGRPGHKLDLAHGEPAFGEQPAIFLDRREEPGRDQRRIAVTPRADRAHRRGDGRDIAMTAKLADEAAARAQRAMHAGDHQMRLAHPMQRRIGEYRVELGDEIERMAVELCGQ